MKTFRQKWRERLDNWDPGKPKHPRNLPQLPSVTHSPQVIYPIRLIYICVYVYFCTSFSALLLFQQQSYYSWSILFNRRRQWHPTPILLPGKSHGRRSLVGCSPWGRYESDTTERLHFHFSLSCIGEGNGNPLQSSCLENPRDGGAWWAAVYGVTQSWTRLKWLSSSRSILFNLFLSTTTRIRKQVRRWGLGINTQMALFLLSRNLCSWAESVYCNCTKNVNLGAWTRYRDRNTKKGSYFLLSHDQA